MLRLLFDENFGGPLVAALAQLCGYARPVPELRHILHFQQQGVKDAEWVPRLAADGWVVVTGDRGRSAGPKLPQLCQACGITHVLLSASLQNSRQFEKARAVLSVWPGLIEAADAPAGTRYVLRFGHQSQAVLVRKDN